MTSQSEENKKYQYYRISKRPDNWQWCYSARDFQKHLDQITKGLVLERLYITFDEYMDGRCYDRNHYNLAFEGGYSLLIFDKLAIEFAIHVEGMVEYNIFLPHQITVEEVLDNEPNRYDSVYTNLIDLQASFDAEYTGKRIIGAEVRHTNMWGFRLEGFDTERANKAAQANDLPERVCFHLENGVQLSLICDDLEYFHIMIE